MKTLLWRFLMVVFLLFLVTGAASMPVTANQGVTWEDPIRLSDPNTMSGQPALAVDQTGVVHVVWSESIHTVTAGEGDTIFYSFWDGDNWSQPMDIIVAAPAQAAQFPEITITPNGYLHVMWSTGGIYSVVKHSRVHLCCVRDIYAWSEPVSVSSPVLLQHAIASDSRGYLYVVHGHVSSRNIVFTMSKDNGDTWSRSVEIAGGAQRPDEYGIFPRLAVSESGRIHLVWNVLPYPGRLAWYVHSDDDGQNWSEPLLVDSSDRSGYREGYGPIVPDIQTYGKNQVHIIWDGAPTVERNHIYSLDDGETWSQPLIVFPEVTGVGRAGWNEMAFDSGGILHTVSILGPLHASWDGRGWSESRDIAVRQYTGEGEMMRIKVGLGNQLHVMWLDRNVSPFTVWYVRGESAAAPIPAIPIPAPETAATEESSAIPTQPSALAAQTSTYTLEDPVDTLDNYSPGMALAASLIPAILVIGAAVVIVYIKRAKP